MLHQFVRLDSQEINAVGTSLSVLIFGIPVKLIHTRCSVSFIEAAHLLATYVIDVNLQVSSPFKLILDCSGCFKGVGICFIAKAGVMTLSSVSLVAGIRVMVLLSRYTSSGV